MKKQATTALKPRVPESLLAIIRSKKGGRMKSKRDQTRSEQKRALQREFMN